MKSKDVASTKTQKKGHFRISLTPRGASHRVLPTTESDSALCITLRSQSPQWASYRGVKLCGVHHTFESKCTPQSQNRNLYESLGAFKGTIRRNPFRGEQFYHVRKDLKKTNFYLLRLKFWLLGVKHTAESNSSNFVIKYLGEIRTELENTLAWLSGARWVRIIKKWRFKISWHTPFKKKVSLTPRSTVWHVEFEQYFVLTSGSFQRDSQIKKKYIQEHCCTGT